MAKIKDQWQDVDTVLALFGKQKYAARKKYRVFVEKGILEGKKSELTGGGLIRSAGGWGVLKSLRRMTTLRVMSGYWETKAIRCDTNNSAEIELVLQEVGHAFQIQFRKKTDQIGTKLALSTDHLKILKNTIEPLH